MSKRKNPEPSKDAADDRVDPTANENESIRRASQNGDLRVVERLLQDERVDPSARDN